MTERWIRLGTVRRINYRHVGNSGYPCAGFTLGWRGARDWCQPDEFDDWAQLEWAVRRRLELAGLKLLAVTVGSTGEARLLRVLVTRLRWKRRPRANWLLPVQS